MCHIKLGQWSSVIEDCQSAIQLDPAVVKAHFYLGQAYVELKNYDEAIESFETGKKVNIIIILKKIINFIIIDECKCTRLMIQYL